MPRSYEIIPLVERTPAWWQWRQGGVGSSDAATVLGEKWAKSVERLLFEKHALPKNAGRHFARARTAALERTARIRYCITVGITVEATCVQNLARPWQRASLDGLSADGERVVEIKCGLATYDSATSRRRPPRHHVAQLQHILAVTGLPVLDFWCYAPPHPPLRLEVRRDEAYIERLQAAELVFWQRFCPASSTPQPGGDAV